MKVQVEYTETKYREIDIEFPIYRKKENPYEEGPSFTYWRTEQNGKTVELNRRQGARFGEVIWEVEFHKFGPVQSKQKFDEFWLGKGKYACSAEEWNVALSEFKKAVEGI